MTLRRVSACMYVYECVVESACVYLLVQGGLANVCTILNIYVILLCIEMSINVNTLQMLPTYTNYEEGQYINTCTSCSLVVKIENVTNTVNCIVFSSMQ